MRRDFINVKRGNPSLEKWSATWVQRIGRLYHLNNQRLECLDQPEQFLVKDQRLREHLDRLVKYRDEELARPRLKARPKKVLKSFRRHWKGLTVFVDHPEIPMDNNAAERALRTPVVGRKNYYGAGNTWSAELAASLFSILMTLNAWHINQHDWLKGYLEACATNNRQAPDDLTDWLPWKMSDERLKELRNHSPPPALLAESL